MFNKTIIASIAVFIGWIFKNCTVVETTSVDSNQDSYNSAIIAQDQQTQPDWIYLGIGGDNAEYYFNGSREVVDGSFWSAPAVRITPESQKSFGEYLLDCQTLTAQYKFANEPASGWVAFETDSPLGAVSNQVCFAE